MRKSLILLAVLAVRRCRRGLRGRRGHERRPPFARRLLDPARGLQRLIDDFRDTPSGDGVGFSQSYAASGEQARAVKAGLKADIVALSLAPDVDDLVKAGLVDAR